MAQDTNSTGNSSSARARRRTPQRSDDEIVKVFFSSGTAIDTNGIQMRKLQAMGIVKTDVIAECDAFCVKRGPDLKRTANVIMAAFQGKHIVTDDWLVSSIRVQRLINPENYLAKNTAEEKRWAFRWTDVSSRGRSGTRTWQGCKILATEDLRTGLRENFENLKSVALLAGASSFEVVSEKSQLNQLGEDVLLVGVANDKLAADLPEGQQCYTKEMITVNALRGKVDWDSEDFLVSPPKSPPRPAKKRKRN